MHRMPSIRDYNTGCDVLTSPHGRKHLAISFWTSLSVQQQHREIEFADLLASGDWPTLALEHSTNIVQESLRLIAELRPQPPPATA